MPINIARAIVPETDLVEVFEVFGGCRVLEGAEEVCVDLVVAGADVGVVDEFGCVGLGALLELGIWMRRERGYVP